MPYKDPEKRRTYQREYKRRLRANEGLTSTCQTQTVRAYICFKAPQLRLPGIAFKFGLFVTDQLEEQAMIENDELYGKEIFRLILDS